MSDAVTLQAVKLVSYKFSQTNFKKMENVIMLNGAAVFLDYGFPGLVVILAYLGHRRALANGEVEGVRGGGSNSGYLIFLIVLALFVLVVEIWRDMNRVTCDNFFKMGSRYNFNYTLISDPTRNDSFGDDSATAIDVTAMKDSLVAGEWISLQDERPIIDGKVSMDVNLDSISGHFSYNNGKSTTRLEVFGRCESNNIAKGIMAEYRGQTYIFEITPDSAG